MIIRLVRKEKMETNLEMKRYKTRQILGHFTERNNYGKLIKDICLEDFENFPSLEKGRTKI